MTEIYTFRRKELVNYTVRAIRGMWAPTMFIDREGKTVIGITYWKETKQFEYGEQHFPSLDDCLEFALREVGMPDAILTIPRIRDAVLTRWFGDTYTPPTPETTTAQAEEVKDGIVSPPRCVTMTAIVPVHWCDDAGRRQGGRLTVAYGNGGQLGCVYYDRDKGRWFWYASSFSEDGWNTTEGPFEADTEDEARDALKAFIGVEKREVRCAVPMKERR